MRGLTRRHFKIRWSMVKCISRHALPTRMWLAKAQLVLLEPITIQYLFSDSPNLTNQKLATFATQRSLRYATGQSQGTLLKPLLSWHVWWPTCLVAYEKTLAFLLACFWIVYKCTVASDIELWIYVFFLKLKEPSGDWSRGWGRPAASVPNFPNPTVHTYSWTRDK